MNFIGAQVAKADDRELQALLSPRSIAIIGASADFDKLNGRTLRSLIDKQFKGALYPVNPKYTELAGIKCYPDVASIPEKVDLAIVALPAAAVPQAIRDLGRHGVRAAVIYSSGFSEIGGEGVLRQQDLVRAIAESGVRVLGPNCLGLINAFERVTATFSQFAFGPIEGGPTALVTQSGALGTTAAGLAAKRGINFGYLVTTGNESDVHFPSVMRDVLADDRIKVGAGFIEGVADGRQLIAVASEALTAGKPLILTKLGRTKAGAKAIASHTGSLAGEQAVLNGIARQLGIQLANSDEQLLDFVQVFSTVAIPDGNGIGIMTRSGGAGALIADTAEDFNLVIASFSSETTAQLKTVVPSYGSTGNPVDVTAQGLVDPTIIARTLRIILADSSVALAIFWIGFTKDVDFLIDAFTQAKAESTKPFIVSWSGAPDEAVKRLTTAGVPVLRGPRPAAIAAAAMVRYSEARKNWLQDSKARQSLTLPKLSFPKKGGLVPTAQASELLGACGIPLARTVFARTAEEAVATARKIGFPVAVKIESPDIAHKTEAKGVVLGCTTDEAVRQAFDQVLANARAYAPKAALDGVVIQAMSKGDVELVIGLKRDPSFGTVVVVGLGGIFVEVLGDISIRSAPVTAAEAHRMLDELRGRALLDGVRGRLAIDKGAVARLISNVSLFGAAAGDRLLELDLNPVFASHDGVVAVDTLLLLDDEK